MEHHVRGQPAVGRLLEQDPDDVVVGVPVVDLQGRAEFAGESDVPAEGLLLRRVAGLVLRPEVVEARLSHRAHAGVAGELRDLRERLLELAALGQAGRVVGVQRHGAEQAGLGLDRRDREPGRGDVAAHLDRAGHAHGLRRVHRLVDVHPDQAVAEVEVRVVVHDGHRQRLRCGRVLEATLAARLLLAGVPARAAVVVRLLGGGAVGERGLGCVGHAPHSREPSPDPRHASGAVSGGIREEHHPTPPPEGTARREGQACAAAHGSAMPMYCTEVYSSMPSAPPSRPRPDCFTPPNGAAGLEMTPTL